MKKTDYVFRLIRNATLCIGMLNLSACMTIVTTLSPAQNCPQTIQLHRTISAETHATRAINPPFMFQPGVYTLLGESKEGVFYAAPKPHCYSIKATSILVTTSSYDPDTGKFSDPFIHVEQPYGFVISRKNLKQRSATVEKMWMQGVYLEADKTSRLTPGRTVLALPPFNIDF